MFYQDPKVVSKDHKWREAPVLGQDVMIQREYNARRANEDTNKENREYRKVTMVEPVKKGVKLPASRGFTSDGKLPRNTTDHLGISTLEDSGKVIKVKKGQSYVMGSDKKAKKKASRGNKRKSSGINTKKRTKGFSGRRVK